jgi:hypothetical protein
MVHSICQKRKISAYHAIFLEVVYVFKVSLSKLRGLSLTQYKLTQLAFLPIPVSSCFLVWPLPIQLQVNTPHCRVIVFIRLCALVCYRMLSLEVRFRKCVHTIFSVFHFLSQAIMLILFLNSVQPPSHRLIK